MKKSSVKKEVSLYVDILGWYGVVAILVAYGLLNFNIFTSSNLLYQALNFTGAFGILYESYRKKDYEPVILNLIWAVIALVVIIKILF